MLKSFPKIFVIVFLATLFFQINIVLASCSYVQRGSDCGSRVLSGITDCQGQPEPIVCGAGYINCDCCCDKPTPPASTQTKSSDIQFIPQVGIPGSEFEKGFNFSKDDSTAPIAKYVRAIYNYAIGIVGILAAVVLMIGGVLWIVAGGNATQIGEAKAWIGASLTGLVLALTSYLILSTVNPALVNLQTTKIDSVGKFIGGSCTYNYTGGGSTCENNSTEKTCTEKGGTFSPGKTCPTACCAYGGRNGGATGGATWAECSAKIILSNDDCNKFSTLSTPQYMPNGECKNTPYGYRCVDKTTYTSCCAYQIPTGEFWTRFTFKCDEGTSEITCRSKGNNFISYQPKGKCENNNCISK